MGVEWISLRDRQRTVLDSILGSAEERWKVLVVDEHGEAIVRELKREGELRKAGVTVVVKLGGGREEVVQGAVGVYLVASTEESARNVAEDARMEVFEKMYVCFLSDPTPVDVLASAVLRPSPPKTLRIISVASTKVDFSCPESSLFLLTKKPSFDDEVTTTAHGIFCAISTLGVVPIIRAQRGTRAEQVADLLTDRIRAEIHSSKLTQTSLVSRPLLVLTDRDKYLSTALRHPWTYRALLHDVLGLRSSKLTVTVREGSTERTVEYELGLDGDEFWTKYATSPFPEVAAALEEELKSYLAEVADVTQFGADSAGMAASLPGLPRRKELIDMHMNIATALLEQIQNRSLDEYFRAEEDAQAGSVDRSVILLLLQSDKGTTSDKIRLFLVCYLAGPSMPKEDIDQYLAALEAAACPMDAVKYAMSLCDVSQREPPPRAAPPEKEKGRLGLMVSSVVRKGKTGLRRGIAEVAQNFHKLVTLSGGRASPLARIVNALMEQRGSTIENGFTFTDPKLRYGADESLARSTRPFQRGIVFVVGGGNYLEYESVVEHTQEGNVIYGTSALLSGEELLTDLQKKGSLSL